jgi:hypothetical protein
MQEQAVVVAQQEPSEQQSEVVAAYVPVNLDAAPILTEAELLAAIKAEHDLAETLLSHADSVLRAGVVHSIREGHFLKEAKRRVKQQGGKWLPWVKAHGISPRTAQVRMKLAESTDAQRAALLSAQSIRGALQLLNGGGRRRKRAEVYCCPSCGCTWDGHPRPDRRVTPDMAVDRVEQERRTA